MWQGNTCEFRGETVLRGWVKVDDVWWGCTTWRRLGFSSRPVWATKTEEYVEVKSGPNCIPFHGEVRHWISDCNGQECCKRKVELSYPSWYQGWLCQHPSSKANAALRSFLSIPVFLSITSKPQSQGRACREILELALVWCWNHKKEGTVW